MRRTNKKIDKANRLARYGLSLLFCVCAYLSHGQVMSNPTKKAFVENTGQLKDADFIHSYISLSDFTAFFKDDGLSICQYQTEGVQRIDITFLGCMETTEIDYDYHPSHVYTYAANGQRIASHPIKSIWYREIYPNIDLHYFLTDSGTLKYDFILHPGADAHSIQLEYSGVDSLSKSPKGDLLVHTDLGIYMEKKPISFQEGQIIGSTYEIEDNTLRFALADYQKDQMLIIDPSVQWATYHGGTHSDKGVAVDYDHSLNLYLIGTTTSWDFPTKLGFFSTNPIGNTDVFISKYTPKGKLIWSSFFGGGKRDEAVDILADRQGALYLTINTSSAGLPVVNNKLNYKSPNEDVYIIKMDTVGNILWSGYFGGRSNDFASALVKNDSNQLFVVGGTASDDLIKNTNVYQHVLAGDTDGFVLRIDTGGNRIWASYYGSSGNDYITAAETTYGQKLLVVGITRDDTIKQHIWTHRAGKTRKTNSTIALINDSSHVDWLRYFGGRGHDVITCIKVSQSRKLVDSFGMINMAGRTSSQQIALRGYPAGNDSLQPGYGGGQTDAFVLQMTHNGRFYFFNYIGGENDDEITSIARDGKVLLYAGNTTSTTMKMNQYYWKNRKLQKNNAGGSDVFYINFNDLYDRWTSSYFGGSGNDYVSEAIFYNGGQLFTGHSFSTDFPVTAGAEQKSLKLNEDAFLAKICTAPYGQIGWHGCTKDGPVFKIDGLPIPELFHPTYKWQTATRYGFEDLEGNTLSDMWNDTIAQKTLYRRVSETGGCQDTSTEILVRRGEYPDVDFDFFGGTCEGDSIELFSTSTISEGGMNYRWLVNQTRISTDSATSHLFSNPDSSYLVKLRVESDSHCVRRKHIDLYYWKPEISFSYQNSCDTDAVIFIPSINYPNAVKVEWFLGNGAYEETNSSFRYSYDTFGIYRVLMRATNGHCFDTFSRWVRFIPKMNIDFDLQNYCVNDSIRFINKTTFDLPIKNYTWVFDHVDTVQKKNLTRLYRYPGTKFIMLKASDIHNCSDSVYKEIKIHEPPKADIKITSKCNVDAIKFDIQYPEHDSIYSTRWSLGDGSPDVEKHRFSHKFPSYGEYTVYTIIKVDSLNCVDSQANTVYYDTALTADFDIQGACENHPIRLMNTTKGGYGKMNWKWSLGDTNTSRNFNLFIYRAAGEYSINLLVIDEYGCRDSTVKSVSIHSNPKAKFTFDTACVKTPFTFTNTSDTLNYKVAKVSWNFGDGQMSEKMNPTNIYTSKGFRMVQMSITTEHGCEDQHTEFVTIRANPSLQDAIVKHINCYMQDSGAIQLRARDGWGGYKIAWDKHPLVSDLKLNGLLAGDYPFTIQDKFGCSFSDHVTIEQPDSLELSQPEDIRMCFGRNHNAEFQGKGGTTPYTFTLSCDAPNCSAVKINSNIYSLYTDENTNYSLKLTDANGCISDTKSFVAKSLPLPDLTLSDSILYVVRNNNFQIEAISSKVTKFAWTPAHLFRNPYISKPTLKVDQNKIITVHSEDTNYCIASSSAEIRVVDLEIPTAFTPNDDGVNDLWVIRGLDLLPNPQITIFNRWGLKLFTSDSENPYWDGYYEGEKVSAAAYYYILKPHVEGQEFTGTINILD